MGDALFMDRIVVKTAGKVQYELIRKTNRRRIALRVTDDARVVVSAPSRTPRTTIDRFVTDHVDWIERKLAAVGSLPKTLPEHTYTDGDRFLVFGEEKILKVQRGGVATTTCKLVEDALVVHARSGAKGSAIGKAITLWYVELGNQVYGELVEKWLGRIGYAGANRPVVVSMASYPKRMGSCSQKGELRFAVRSLMLPLPLVDYLALHEVAHLVHFNHGASFKQLLESCMPDWKLRQHEMSSLRIRTAHI